MNDLLPGLRGTGPQQVTVALNNDVEMGLAPRGTEQSSELTDFFRRVEDIKADMAEIRALQRQISSQHEAGKTIIKTREMQRHQADMQVCPERRRLNIQQLCIFGMLSAVQGCRHKCTENPRWFVMSGLGVLH